MFPTSNIRGQKAQAREFEFVIFVINIGVLRTPRSENRAVISSGKVLKK